MVCLLPFHCMGCFHVPVVATSLATFGVQMAMEDDEGPYNNGGIWIYKPMSYTKGTNATGGEVIQVHSLNRLQIFGLIDVCFEYTI